jgi:hypothetical protein
MGTARDPLHLDKLNLVRSKIMDIATRFILINVLFDVAFKYTMVPNI